MKPIFYIISILAFIALFSCMDKNREKYYNNIRFIESKYPNYSFHLDSNYGFFYYNNMYNNKLADEVMKFDCRGQLVEYTFYNISVNLPVYTIYFDTNGKVTDQVGHPSYIVSNYFDDSVFADDSFDIFAYIATPPNFNSEISLFYKSKEFKDLLLYKKFVPDDFTIHLKHKIRMKKRKIENYYMISKITSNIHKNFVRLDTINFSIKIKDKRI